MLNLVLHRSPSIPSEQSYGELAEQLPSPGKQRIRDQISISYRAFKPGTQMHLYTQFCALQLRTAGQSCRISLSSLLVVILLAAFVLMPACGSSNNSSGSGTCTTVPGAPTGLAASNTTGSGTTLNWTAPTGLAANCSVTGYTIYENGTSIGTSTTTSFNVTGLSPSTMYSFTVAASDAAGLGAQSSAASVTTAAAGDGNDNPRHNDLGRSHPLLSGLRACRSPSKSADAPHATRNTF